MISVMLKTGHEKERSQYKLLVVSFDLFVG